jgi:hypothetical protein
MQEPLAALHEVTEFLDQHQLGYLVLGGVANAIWGRPRATQDADFKVLVGERTIRELVILIGSRFEFRVQDPVAFAQQTYVVPVYASNHIGVDLGLGFFPYEEQAVKKAVVVEYQGVTFRVCTAEDLIIHKAISPREKDWSDIAGVLVRQGNKLDQGYILHWLTQFAQVLEEPELVRRYENLRQQIHSDSPE